MMVRKIDSEKEYERRRKLLEEHEDQERKRFRKDIVKTVLPVPDVSDVVETIIDVGDDS